MMDRTDAWRASDDLQFADLPGLLHHRDGASLRALLLVAPEEDQPATCILPVLRGVEPTFCHFAVDFDRRRLVGRAMDGPGQKGTDAQAVDADQRLREPRHARLLQIWRVPAR